MLPLLTASCSGFFWLLDIIRSILKYKWATDAFLVLMNWRKHKRCLHRECVIEQREQVAETFKSWGLCRTDTAVLQTYEVIICPKLCHHSPAAPWQVSCRRSHQLARVKLRQAISHRWNFLPATFKNSCISLWIFGLNWALQLTLKILINYLLLPDTTALKWTPLQNFI